jgi:hypothetical protein
MEPLKDFWGPKIFSVHFTHPETWTILTEVTLVAQDLVFTPE